MEGEASMIRVFVAGLAAGQEIEFCPFRPSFPRTPLLRAANLSGLFYCPDCSLTGGKAVRRVNAVRAHIAKAMLASAPRRDAFLPFRELRSNRETASCQINDTPEHGRLSFGRCWHKRHARTAQLTDLLKRKTSGLLMSLAVFPFFLTLCAGVSIGSTGLRYFSLGGLSLFSALSFPFNCAMTTYQSVEALARKHGYKSYNDYLFRSDHWKALRKAMNLNENPCCVCYGSSSVPHHMRYRDLIDVTTNDLVAMCMKCHDDFHLACRIGSLNYIGMEALRISDTVLDFRRTDFYLKREEKLKRRRSGIKVVRTTNREARNLKKILVGCVGRCRHEKYSIASLENFKAKIDEIIKEKMGEKPVKSIALSAPTQL